MEICNLNYLKSVSPNNPKFITEMIEIFLKNVPVAVEAMKASLAPSDWSTIQHHSHKLRSHIDCMGISKKYGEMAKEIEEYAKKQEHIELISEMVLELDTVFEKAYAELRAELNAVK